MSAATHVVVVIVSYKSQALTLRALTSLASERTDPALSLRVIVVENASGDGAALHDGIARDFSDFATLLVSEVNGGFGAGNNLALKAVYEAGDLPDYFLFLNPDTEVRPGAVGALVRFMNEHPRVGIAGSRFEHADGSDWPIGFRFPSPLSEIDSGCSIGLVSRLLASHAVARTMGSEPEQADWLPGASMMVRRALIEQIGGFDESYFLYFEETDLCLRAQKAGFECWHVPESRVMHIRGQSTGVTALGDKPRRLPRYWFESRRRYYLKNYGVLYAAMADLAFFGGNLTGLVKRTLKGQPTTPHLLRDFVSESVLRPRHQTLARERCFVPAQLEG